MPNAGTLSVIFPAERLRCGTCYWERTSDTKLMVEMSFRFRLQSGSGLASAVLFALRDCSYAMSRESLALLFTDHRNFDARARIPLLMLEMDYANIDAGYSRVLVYGKVDFGI